MLRCAWTEPPSRALGRAFCCRGPGSTGPRLQWVLGAGLRVPPCPLLYKYRELRAPHRVELSSVAVSVLGAAGAPDRCVPRGHSRAPRRDPGAVRRGAAVRVALGCTGRRRAGGLQLGSAGGCSAAPFTRSEVAGCSSVEVVSDGSGKRCCSREPFPELRVALQGPELWLNI